MSRSLTVDDLPPGDMRFLLRRVFAQKNYQNPRCYGHSSDALAFYGVGLQGEPQLNDYPMDDGDLDACELTFDMAPSRLKPKMLPVLVQYRAYVDERKAKAQR